MNFLLNLIKDFLSNEENQKKIFYYFNKIVDFLRIKKLLKFFIFYLFLFLFLLFVIFFKKIDIVYFLQSRIDYINQVVFLSNDGKLSMAGSANKDAIKDTTNNVFASDGFKIEKIKNDYIAYRSFGSIGNNYKQYIIENNVNEWNDEILDVNKCKILIESFNDLKSFCIIRTVNNNDVSIILNNCFVLKNFIQKNILKITKETAILICGIKQTEFSYYYFIYLGKNYYTMQEFSNNIFLNKIVDEIFKINIRDYEKVKIF